MVDGFLGSVLGAVWVAEGYLYLRLGRKEVK